MELVRQRQDPLRELRDRLTVALAGSEVAVHERLKPLPELLNRLVAHLDFLGRRRQDTEIGSADPVGPRGERRFHHQPTDSLDVG